MHKGSVISKVKETEDQQNHLKVNAFDTFDHIVYNLSLFKLSSQDPTAVSNIITNLDPPRKQLNKESRNVLFYSK